jgi:hypothetical protein
MWQKVAKFKGAEYFRKALYIKSYSQIGLNVFFYFSSWGMFTFDQMHFLFCFDYKLWLDTNYSLKKSYNLDISKFNLTENWFFELWNIFYLFFIE